MLSLHYDTTVMSAQSQLTGAALRPIRREMTHRIARQLTALTGAARALPSGFFAELRTFIHAAWAALAECEALITIPVAIGGLSTPELRHTVELLIFHEPQQSDSDSVHTNIHQHWQTTMQQFLATLGSASRCSDVFHVPCGDPSLNGTVLAITLSVDSCHDVLSSAETLESLTSPEGAWRRTQRDVYASRYRAALDAVSQLRGNILRLAFSYYFDLIVLSVSNDVDLQQLHNRISTEELFWEESTHTRMVTLSGLVSISLGQLDATACLLRCLTGLLATVSNRYPDEPDETVRISIGTRVEEACSHRDVCFGNLTFTFLTASQESGAFTNVWLGGVVCPCSRDASAVRSVPLVGGAHPPVEVLSSRESSVCYNALPPPIAESVYSLDDMESEDQPEALPRQKHSPERDTSTTDDVRPPTPIPTNRKPTAEHCGAVLFASELAGRLALLRSHGRPLPYQPKHVQEPDSEDDPEVMDESSFLNDDGSANTYTAVQLGLDVLGHSMSGTYAALCCHDTATFKAGKWLCSYTEPLSLNIVGFVSHMEGNMTFPVEDAMSIELVETMLDRQHEPEVVATNRTRLEKKILHRLRCFLGASIEGPSPHVICVLQGKQTGQFVAAATMHCSPTQAASSTFQFSFLVGVENLAMNANIRSMINGVSLSTLLKPLMPMMSIVFMIDLDRTLVDTSVVYEQFTDDVAMKQVTYAVGAILRTELIYLRPKVLDLLDYFRTIRRLTALQPSLGAMPILVTKSTTARAKAILHTILDPVGDVFTHVVAAESLKDMWHRTSSGPVRKSSTLVLKHLGLPLNAVPIVLDDAPEDWVEDDWPNIVPVCRFSDGRFDSLDSLWSSHATAAELAASPSTTRSPTFSIDSTNAVGSSSTPPLVALRMVDAAMKVVTRLINDMGAYEGDTATTNKEEGDYHNDQNQWHNLVTSSPVVEEDDACYDAFGGERQHRSKFDDSDVEDVEVLPQ